MCDMISFLGRKDASDRILLNTDHRWSCNAYRPEWFREEGSFAVRYVIFSESGSSGGIETIQQHTLSEHTEVPCLPFMRTTRVIQVVIRRRYSFRCLLRDPDSLHPWSHGKLFDRIRSMRSPLRHSASEISSEPRFSCQKTHLHTFQEKLRSSFS